jgi:hypothetical protein
MSHELCVEVEPSRLARDITAQLCSIDESITESRSFRWLHGASVDAMPWLEIVEARSTACWHYISAGASRILDMPGYGLEFCFRSRVKDIDCVELVSMVAYLHGKPDHRLDVGHTMSIGKPIVEGSNLDRLLVSLPYPYGASFEYAHLSDDAHARFLWLLPITAAEEKFRHEFGLEALESKFEATGIDYLDPQRASLC